MPPKNILKRVLESLRDAQNVVKCSQNIESSRIILCLCTLFLSTRGGWVGSVGWKEDSVIANFVKFSDM